MKTAEDFLDESHLTARKKTDLQEGLSRVQPGLCLELDAAERTRFCCRFFQSGPRAFVAMDSPIARSLISSLAFKSLTSGAFNFFRVGIFFHLTLEAKRV